MNLLSPLSRFRSWIGLVCLIGLLAGCPSSSPTSTPEIVPMTAVPMAASPAPAPPTTGAEKKEVASATHPPTAKPEPTPGATEMPSVGNDPTQVTAPAFDPSAIQLALAPVVQGIDLPLFATHAGDGSGRLFVVEKGGSIQVVIDGNVLTTPYLDLKNRVNSGGSEQGLLGLAFAPNFVQSGHFFVNYTDFKGETVVSRFQAANPRDNRVDPASEFPILVLAQPARNHNGGMLAFGPDGYLYIGTGDGGAANDRFENGQNPQSLLGKMLRLDVTSDPTQAYTIPADNPWVTADWNGQDVRDEVWAMGLRNPWRFSFDRLTGDLWIGDVGQNTYEEINVVTADHGSGLNFGWPIMEGTHCFPDRATCDSSGLEIPITDYSHQVGGCSVTGGYVYRGEQFPQLTGIYLFGDFCTGNVWAIWPLADSTWTTELMLRSGIQISSFAEDAAGELYTTDLAGTLYQIVIQ